ncbi:tripartite tricarboxylate transporter substrate binding protein [Polaromonas sp. YR568]|uniref:Bug family tripartite tricarboxylate transporter substrate binding protein n=1 Tax=Polaromonas sp. YR568 TaxID=1855301 RepID=UPI003137F963
MLVVTGASWAQAQSAGSYPNRPIKLIVTVPPGGAADFIARLLATKLSASMGQPVVVENKGGASGALATDFVAKAAPDGYTLLQNSISTHGIGPFLVAKLPYDPVTSFTPITMLASLPLIMTINADVKAATLPEFITVAKQNQGKLAFASSGAGGAPHMAGELFKIAAGVDMIHTPYRGSGPAVVDLAGGQVQAMFDGAPSLLPQITNGKIKAIAAASPKRNPLLPDVPTFAELGYPSVNVALWYGLMAPAGTPPDIIARLNREVNQALKSPDVVERFAAQGTEALGGTPEQAASYMRQEMDRWGPVVKKAGIVAN